MGAFYGLKAASQAGFAAMVLVCPASEETMLKAIASSEAASARGDSGRALDASAESETPAPPTRWDFVRLRAYFERQDSGLLAAGVTCPVLLVHARDDEVVPLEHSLFLAGRMVSETTLLALAGGSHGTAQHDPAVHRYSVGWLAAKLMH